MGKYTPPSFQASEILLFTDKHQSILHFGGQFYCKPVGCLHLGNYLGSGFKYVLFSPLLGQMIRIDYHIFQMGWFNHQPGIVVNQPTNINYLSPTSNHEIYQLSDCHQLYDHHFTDLSYVVVEQGLFLFFHPDNWGRFSSIWSYCSDGWFNPPTCKGFFRGGATKIWDEKPWHPTKQFGKIQAEIFPMIWGRDLN